jgi:hypothetical protein
MSKSATPLKENLTANRKQMDEKKIAEHDLCGILQREMFKNSGEGC